MEELLERFAAANPRFRRPNLVIIPEGRLRNYLRSNRHVGYYRPWSINVDPPRCTRPGTGYSWPGHVSDRTLLGVVAHELGHHIHLGCQLHDEVLRIQRLAAKIKKLEPGVTGYEANPDEVVAEAFRLYVTNPDLLRRGRPRRFGLVEELGVVTIEDRPWRDVLGNIPAHMLARIEPWISRSR